MLLPATFPCGTEPKVRVTIRNKRLSPKIRIVRITFGKLYREITVHTACSARARTITATNHGQVSIAIGFCLPLWGFWVEWDTAWLHGKGDLARKMRMVRRGFSINILYEAFLLSRQEALQYVLKTFA